MTPYELSQKIQRTISELPKVSQQIIRDNEQEIVELNQEQLYSGYDSDNQQIFPAYSGSTIFIKRSKNQPFNRVTLFDTGDFYRGFRIKLNGYNKPFNIFSTDSKSSDLVDKYGSSIFGLNRTNQEYINYEIIKPELERYLRSQFG